MGPLFSLALLALFASILVGIVFVVCRIRGLSLRSSFITAAVFVIGAIDGAIAAAVISGVVMGFGQEIASSLGVAAYLCVLCLGGVFGGLLAVNLIRHYSRAGLASGRAPVA
jgi:hypothetical protein